MTASHILPGPQVAPVAGGPGPYPGRSVAPVADRPGTLPERLHELDNLTLDKGSHPTFTAGHCAMEVAAWLAGEPHTDRPECVAPPLRTLMIGLNDRWDPVTRQRLKPLVARVVGTAGDGQDEARSLLVLDWLIRTYTPAWLDLAGLTAAAQSLRGLRRIVDVVAAREAGPVVRAARTSAAAARDAARDAAGAAAWDAAGDAAWAAARAAASAAAADAAGDAAWAAARAAAGDAAWDAAWAAAGDAAWAAASAAAGDAARDAARDAASAALAPTVAQLQASALTLIEAMIDPARLEAL